MNAQFSNNVIRIPLKVTNVYLIPCKDGYVQVDTGYDRDYPVYRRQLKKAGLELSDIKYLFLTHHHDDHAGSLNELTRDTQLTIIANRLAKDLLLTGKNDQTHGGGWVSPMVRGLAKIMMFLDPHWTLEFPPFKLRNQDILVDSDDCEVLRKIGVPGDILYTPGHCIDHQALLLDSGDLICGDAACNMPSFLGTHYATIFMTDMETAYQSWQKLLDAGARTIYPSHGNPFPSIRLRENIGKIQTRNLIRL